jgi:hypothetical protein
MTTVKGRCRSASSGRFVGYSEVGPKTGFSEMDVNLFEADFWPRDNIRLALYPLIDV